MSEAVKRTYSSQLRENQARQTRHAIVDAASRLFIERGFGLTTIDDIAAEAGVSRKTVFTSVGGKVDILKVALDWAVAGDDEPIPLIQRAPIRNAETANDPELSIKTWVDVVCTIVPRTAGLFAVLRSAAGNDPQAQKLLATVEAQRLSGAQHFVGMLHRQGGLRKGLTRDKAIDIVNAYNDPQLFFRLVTDRGWSLEAFRSWLHEAIRFQLRGASPD